MIKLHSIARQVADDAGMEELFSAAVSREGGLEGDLSPLSDGGEVAVVSRESWIKVCHETGTEVPWLANGANLLIKGFEFLPTDIGRLLRIGEVELEIDREHLPNGSLQQRAPALFEALLLGWRGGVVCKVVRSGDLQTGDNVDIVG